MSDDRFAAFVRHVGEFHITDREMKSAHAEILRRTAEGRADDGARRQYLGAVKKYFAAFEREARSHLRDVDRRLEHLNQVQFNLTAERGVAVKRIEATQGVLADITRLEAAE